MTQFRVRHETTYTYNQSVSLKPHLVRLRPRSNHWQSLREYRLEVSPEPVGRSDVLDLDGNAIVKLWFDTPTDKLQLVSTSVVETHQTNPFNFLLDPTMLRFPFDYPSSLRSQLQPYLNPLGTLPATGDPIATELAEELLHLTENDPIQFLGDLNQRIYTQCDYIVRPDGAPRSPGITWRNKRGSCRDFAVLFVAVCRAAGLAARFVSGYQEGDLDTEAWDLHAWVEVYLPGAGWRGYDPTHGLLVADGHIALVASPYPSYAAPVEGTVVPLRSPAEGGSPPSADLRFDIHLDRL